MILRGLYEWPSLKWGGALGEIAQMRNQMDRLLEGVLGRSGRYAASGVFPLINLTEDKNNYYVRAELPGVSSDELDIQITGKTLTISGARKIQAENENARYHRREREAGNFSRGISLPGDIDAGKVDAKLTDGILTVIIPKAEAAKPKQISIK